MKVPKLLNVNLKTRFLVGLMMFLHKEDNTLSEQEKELYKFILSKKHKLQGYQNKGRTYWSIWG